MKSYKSYQTTDEKWLPEIPEGWQAIRMKYLFEERSEKGYPQEHLLVASQEMGVVPKDVYGKRTVIATKDLHQLKLVKEGDFVISLRSFQGGIEKAYYQGIISQAYTILRSKNRFEDYFKYLGKSAVFVQLLKACVTGIREGQNIEYGALRDHRLPVPSQAEQDQIVCFLDWKVSKINKLILNNKKEIATLNEIKRKLIDDATIAGLRKTEMTHNDTSWRIDFPSHWKLQRAGRSFTLRKGLSITKENLEESGIAVINYGEVHSKKNSGVGLNDELIKYVNESYLNTNPSALVKKGDFIFADTSEDLAGCGNCAYVDWEGNVFAGYHSIIAHMDGTGDNKYFAYLFRAPRWRYQVRKRANRVKVYSITQYILKDVFILIPPEEEQVEIVRYLDGKCAKIDKMIANIEMRINLLEGLKTSLISDVVKGQIDVRDVEIPEYE